ncbi:helix-turn-helix transcriptional regulator [Agrobacterium vitis]|uniref:HTH cro/C1-type domain-containing protein n=1 Tax=Agrobacterium vitis TaxID=373 RepID=A0AAE5AWZ2_AGRVI|nr:helix-turn-helix transcriptional regulator [Agrobacterium vitis]MCF1500546.1 helix-turn-helix transcriptional regulator [Allorhizobium sp. Av2]MCM2441857.1 helix-turn-helix transcriptional regulator [Agrobacterium vitis]MUZ59858.1 hypothetical protein [Agrobacterium vitis]MVA66935.1 hypothetical protein [Agrobacterium vitis]MVA88997.1 hypothetical protein [Agrobacterium vitis]
MTVVKTRFVARHHCGTVSIFVICDVMNNFFCGVEPIEMANISVAVLNGSTAWQSDGRVFLTRMRGRRISIWIYFKLAIMRVKNLSKAWAFGERRSRECRVAGNHRRFFHGDRIMGLYDINRLLNVNDDTLGGRLATARDCAGMDLADLASIAGVPVAKLRSWEADRSEADARSLGLVADSLGVCRQWLMTGNGRGPDEEDNGGDAEDDMLLVMRRELDRLTHMYQETGSMIEILHRRIGDLEQRSSR